MLLAIDTCGSHGSVALARLDGAVTEREGKPTLLAQTALPGKTYSARLLPAIRDLLAAHSVALPDLSAIVVTSGPGSFTGIRIGLSTAKGLSEVHSIPLLAVSRLAVLAHKASAHAAALDASRGEFYCGQYPQAGQGTPGAGQGTPGAGQGTPREALLTRDAFLEQAAILGPALAICEASAHALAPSAILVDPPTAFDALRCALPSLHARAFDDPVTLDGNYLRRSDAEIFAKAATARP